MLDVVDVTKNPRDMCHALQLFYNMAACYQKLGQLDECSMCLETCFEYLECQQGTHYSASFHMHRLRFEIILRL